MSAVNLLSSLKEKPTDESQTNGINLSGLDENGGSGGGGDPAVLAVGPARRPLRYTRDELMRFRNSPLVKRGLENAFAGNESLALVLKRRSDSPNEEDKGARGDAPTENHKGVYGRERERDRDRERRSADPRERVRKESEPSSGIVLSPQRRSFTSGCGAPAAAAPPPHLARTRPESPLSAAHQPIQPKTEQVGRRIGSGRIMVRDVPPGGWEDGDRDNRDTRDTRESRESRELRELRSEPYRPPRDRDRDRDDRRTNGDRFDRRSFTRDSYSSDIKRERDDRFNNEKQRDREDNRRGRFSQRRFEKEDEPEWFSGGPTSQLETIELRGFDEPIKKNGSGSNKENEKWNSGGSKSPDRWRAEPSPPPAQHADSLNNSNDKDSGVESKTEEPPLPPDQPDFNLDEFLKFDSIPDVLTNGNSEEGSRFSRWFHRDSPPTTATTATDRHYERLMHNMIDDLDSSSNPPPLPSPPVAYPTPMQRPQPTPPSLLDLLRRAGADADQRQAEMNSVGGKIHSLEELEARLRPQPPPVHDHDLSAFKRLLAQVSGGHAVTAEPPRPQPPQPQPQPQPMSLLQMLSKSMEQQQQQQQQQHQQQQQQQQQQQKAPHIPQELLYKLLQVQQRQQVAGECGMGGMSSMPPSDRDLLQRPEAQAIIHGLKAGEITAQHLMQQLGNPGLQSRHRELLLTILRTHQQRQQMGGSPLPTNVPPAHLVVPPHHQPLRLSPLPHPAFCVSPIMAASPNTLTVHHPGVPARVPSPRELAAHTQSIMQGALIKKKLEEQRENFRRRHEIQQTKQATPISFTPTSVLRKMTAEKEEGGSPKSSWAPPSHAHQAHAKPHGRPIVKQGNQSAQATMGFASQQDYQQHIFNQQMANANRPFPHQQQRQQIPNNLNNMGSVGGMSRGAGTTLHQLLVQSHQRSLNEMGGGSGGGDNQLARWFSPELLARASAGKLPSVHVPNALSLEDLERHHHSPAPPVRN